MAAAHVVDARADAIAGELQGRAGGGRALCAAFMDAKREVIDPNERRLTEHLEGMWTEQVGAAKKELEGSRLRDVMRAHARTINGCSRPRWTTSRANSARACDPSSPRASPAAATARPRRSTPNNDHFDPVRHRVPRGLR